MSEPGVSVSLLQVNKIRGCLMLLSHVERLRKKSGSPRVNESSQVIWRDLRDQSSSESGRSVRLVSE